MPETRGHGCPRSNLESALAVGVVLDFLLSLADSTYDARVDNNEESNMKRTALLLLAVVFVGLVLADDLIITSFNRNGELTWTNSVANATYRVEWASSAEGPWNKFDALTNLTLLSATTNVVTVKVPMFYRVVWLDAAAYAGTYNYAGYDSQGSLVVTGRLFMSAATNLLTGTWSLQRVGSSTADIGPQVGNGQLVGSGTGGQIWINLNPDWADNNVILGGNLMGNNFTGRWDYSGFTWRAGGTFKADKTPSGN